MARNSLTALDPGALTLAGAGFHRAAPRAARALPEFTMPDAPCPDARDLRTLTAALNRMAAHNGFPFRGGVRM